MALYTVKRAVVKVQVGPATGNRIARILRAGDVVPDGVDEKLLESLVQRGQIELVPEESDEVEIPEGDPSEVWTAKQLKAYAAAKEIALGDAKNKPDILAAIVAANSAKQ